LIAALSCSETIASAAPNPPLPLCERAVALLVAMALACKGAVVDEIARLEETLVGRQQEL